MTPERYNDLVERFGWSTGGKAARALRISFDTERKWVSGKLPIPFSVAMLLELVNNLGISWQSAMWMAEMEEPEDQNHDQTPG
jgi:hypothetical protein